MEIKFKIKFIEHTLGAIMFYPAQFEPAEEGGFNVTFRDIPEAITCGDNYEDAIFMAQDALITAMDFYFEDRRAVPAPSKARKGDVMIELPDSIYANVLLHNTNLEKEEDKLSKNGEKLLQEAIDDL